MSASENKAMTKKEILDILFEAMAGLSWYMA